MVLPGFDSLRVAARFAMVATLCLSVAAGLAFSHLACRLGRWRPIVATLIATGILADGWIGEMPLVAAPPLWRAEQCVSMRGALLELPLGDPERDVAAMYRSMHHGRAVVNGYSGYLPPHYAALRHGLALHDNSLLESLTALGVAEVAVDESARPGWRVEPLHFELSG